MDEQTITLTIGAAKVQVPYTREEYESLKQSGLLWELDPNAPAEWPFPTEIKLTEAESLRADNARLERQLRTAIAQQEAFRDMARRSEDVIWAHRMNLDKETKRANRAEQELAKATSELTTLFGGDKLPEDASNNALGVQEYIAGLRRALDATRKAEVAYQERAAQLQKTLDMLLAHDPRQTDVMLGRLQEDSGYLNTYIRMTQEEYPYIPYYRTSDGCWVHPYPVEDKGFGKSTGLRVFMTFYDAMDSAMKIAFPS